MLNDGLPSSCEILYVDDEEKALKYLRLAFASKYVIHTATSAKEGLEIMRREGLRIGIVISDQRMPEMLGVDFLGIIREEFPQVVRILATAYSDLESAIQSVNRGHIYQYVVKPWDVKELGMVLQRAADYHFVLSERNRLLTLKMSTLQRIIFGDRLLWLLLFRSSLDEALKNPYLRALQAYLQALPAPAFPPEEFSGAGQFEANVILRGEYDNAVQCLSTLELSAVLNHPEGARGFLKEELARFATLFADKCKVPPEACQTSLSEGDASQVEVLISLGEKELPQIEIERSLFGLLLTKTTDETALVFFRILVGLAFLKGSLRVSAPGGKEYLFSLNEEIPVKDGDLIDTLYQRISVWDIANR